jgi:hypothetical protein
MDGGQFGLLDARHAVVCRVLTHGTEVDDVRQVHEPSARASSVSEWPFLGPEVAICSDNGRDVRARSSFLDEA